jgi:hypothetical protein
MIRGKFIAEMEDAMPVRRAFNVLLWLDRLTRTDYQSLADLDRLRIYLKRGLGNCCEIQLFATSDRTELIAQTTQFRLDVLVVPDAPAPTTLQVDVGNTALGEAIAVASRIDADCIVVPSELLPYIETVDEHYHLMLLDPSFLLRQVEIFVRGFEVPWSFSRPVAYQTFSTFYQLSEQPETFQPGYDLMNTLTNTKQLPETIEAGRTLIFNRLANLCFTRDRLQFFTQQKDAALRRKAKRQQFAFEIAYYLNFYYLLLYGAFDHAALLVNGICNLGLKNRDVGASYKGFLDALQQHSADLHAIFTKPSTVESLERFGALRHYAAHRGSIAPTRVVEKPDKELTDAEIDAAIRKDGKNNWIFELNDGLGKEALLGMIRFNTKAEIYEEKTLVKDVVLIEIQGKAYFMHPLSDTTWNFRRVTSFLHEVFTECNKFLT